MMLNKNDDVKRNMSIDIYFFKLMTLNKMFMFHYINLIRTPAIKWNLLLIWKGSRRD